uniref:Uncharacterized protein n=1 Tax=Romanomermis culicivorax TaxID=13658 RepID=A0A915KYC3_ROMCU
MFLRSSSVRAVGVMGMMFQKIVNSHGQAIRLSSDERSNGDNVVAPVGSFAMFKSEIGILRSSSFLH